MTSFPSDRLGLSLALVMLLVLVACGPSPLAARPPDTPTPAPTSTALPALAGPQIEMHNFTFAPDTLTVPVGATVTWTNHDDIPHTVTSTGKVFTSAALDTNDRFSYQFTRPGTYAYFCSIHPKMTATIVVQ